MKKFLVCAFSLFFQQSFAQDKYSVLVFDQGFDVSHPVFKDKIKATYTFDCPAGGFEILPPKLPQNFSKLTFKKQKDAINSELQKKLKSCEIREGLPALNLALPADIAKKRDAFNKAVNNNTMSEKSFKDIQSWLGPLMASGQYHGTATAGLIAENNDNVELILVGIKLAGADALEQFKNCPSQNDLDALAKVFSDKKILSLFTSNDVEKIIRPIFEKHKVDFANLSAGVLPRKTLEQFYKQLGCGEINLKPIYQIFEKISVMEAKTNDQTISVLAAGNEHAALNSATDGAICPAKSSFDLLVGSVGKNNTISSFSNYGKCVKFYANGENIVVPFPHGFYIRQSGTSFSAPLIVRRLTETPKRLKTAKLRLEWLKSQLDSKGVLKLREELHEK